MAHIEGTRPQGGALNVLLTRHEGLGQRRALVGEIGLVANQGDGSLVAFRAQRRGNLEPGLPGSDNHHAVRRHCCFGGVLTIRPSSSLVTGIWQPRRLFGRRSEAVVLSISSSSSWIGFSRPRNA